jgi:hypothetical protein
VSEWPQSSSISTVENDAFHERCHFVHVCDCFCLRGFKVSLEKLIVFSNFL